MASSTGTEAALQAMRILENWREGLEDPFSKAAPVLCPTSLELEWREVLEGVLESLAAAGADANRIAACHQMLLHLTNYPARSRSVWVS